MNPQESMEIGCVVPGRFVQIHCRRGLQPPKYPSEAGWAGRGRTAEECQGRVWNVCNSVKSVGALPAPTDVWASRLGGRIEKWSLPALLLLESLPTIPALPAYGTRVLKNLLPVYTMCFSNSYFCAVSL